MTELPQFYALKCLKYNLLKENEVWNINYENFRDLHHADSF